MKQSRSRYFAAGIAGCLTFTLAACGHKTLDFRNAQINNGKVYAGDSNTPFSGKVTNVPAGTIFGPQQGYGKLLNTVNAARPGTTLGDMGMSSMCDAQANDGLLSGQVVCKTAQSDTTRIEANFTDGVLDGPFTAHDQTGNNTFVELSFKHGMPDGKMKIYSPATGKLVHTATWDAGVLDGEEEGFDETTGNRVLHATLSSGKYTGEFDRYAPDGKQLVYQVSYADGQLNGDEKAFDPQSGQMTGEAHYVNGKLDGVVRHWNANGALLDEKIYENGVDVAAAKAEAEKQEKSTEANEALNDPVIGRCVQDLRGAYKEKNNTSIDNDDLIIEWRNQCKKQSAAPNT